MIMGISSTQRVGEEQGGGVAHEEVTHDPGTGAKREVQRGEGRAGQAQYMFSQPQDWCRQVLVSWPSLSSADTRMLRDPG